MACILSDCARATGVNDLSARCGSMKKRMIYITNFDRKRLEELVASCRLHEMSGEKQKLLNLLEGRLRRSRVVPWKEIKPTVVTMDSNVRLKKLDDNEETDYSLVFPEDENLIRNKISILSHMGISLFGRNVNDVIKTRTNEGIQHFVIDSILYQPEANSNCSRQNI